ncbi:MAG: hypothetical protein JXR03_15395 [Cyclobacteriaceae bacterium]
MPEAATLIDIETKDGYSISASLYQGTGKSKHLIIICPAAGAPQRYYRGFADFASQDFEFDALTFDYRDIGASKKQSIKSSKATMYNWGEYDIKATIDWADEEYDKIFILGHSVAGQVLPYADNNERISAAYFVASQSPYFGYWSGFSQLKALIFWHIIIPMTTLIHGYLPGWAMGGNVSLPKGVAQEWRRWGLSQDGYTRSDANAKEKFNALRIPMHFVGLADDLLYAPSEAVQALMRRYGNAKTSFQYIRPGDLGLKSIGHFGFFRSKYEEKFWSMPIMYFTQFVKKF